MKSLAKLALAVLVLGIVAVPGYADTVTETTTTTVTTMRTNTPIYMGPVQDVQLEELTQKDFDGLVVKPVQAQQLYDEYQKELNKPRPNPTLVPYKMKITDRDLTIADFRGGEVPEELAQERYQEYLKMNPVSTGGQSVRYVYVYHTPVTIVTTSTNS